MSAPNKYGAGHDAIHRSKKSDCPLVQLESSRVALDGERVHFERSSEPDLAKILVNRICIGKFGGFANNCDFLFGHRKCHLKVEVHRVLSHFDASFQRLKSFCNHTNHVGPRFQIG